MTNPVVSIKGIHKAFQQQRVLTNVDLDLNGGCITALAGRNGAGKTTLMRIIANQEQPDSGRVIYAPQQSILMLSSSQHFPGFLAIEQLRYLLTQNCPAWNQERFLHIIGLFKLKPSQRYGNLSSGEAAGVKLAIFLAQQPTVWLLDEVTHGLDIVAAENCLLVLFDYSSEDKPRVLYCSHNVAELEFLSDEIVILHNGVIVSHDQSDALIHSEFGFAEQLKQRFKDMEVLV